MSRRSRLVFVAVLVVAAACSAGVPTEPAPNTMSPEALFDGSGAGGDTTCRGGYPNGNGKTC